VTCGPSPYHGEPQNGLDLAGSRETRAISARIRQAADYAPCPGDPWHPKDPALQPGANPDRLESSKPASDLSERVPCPSRTASAIHTLNRQHGTDARLIAGRQGQLRRRPGHRRGSAEGLPGMGFHRAGEPGVPRTGGPLSRRRSRNTETRVVYVDYDRCKPGCSHGKRVRPMSSARADASRPVTGGQSRADLGLSGFLLPTVSETRPSAVSRPLPPEPVPDPPLEHPVPAKPTASRTTANTGRANLAMSATRAI